LRFHWPQAHTQLFAGLNVIAAIPLSFLPLSLYLSIGIVWQSMAHFVKGYRQESGRQFLTFWGAMRYYGDAMPEWMTINEACTYLRVNPRTLYRLMREDRLPYHTMPSGRRRLLREDLDALLRLAPTGDAEPQP